MPHLHPPMIPPYPMNIILKQLRLPKRHMFLLALPPDEKCYRFGSSRSRIIILLGMLDYLFFRLSPRNSFVPVSLSVSSLSYLSNKTERSK